MLPLREEYAERLLFFAKTYESAGFSVIPLLGDTDPGRAKQPAIKWGRYQHRRAVPDEFHDWFINRGYGGLGIVLGRTSGLVVLDFDDEALVSEFRHLHPDLTDTYTVQSGTRRLPHFYYVLADGMEAHSKGVLGLDFRADGSYVVAPPTRVGDAEWLVVSNAKPRVLSKDDLRRVYRFLASVTASVSSKRLKPPSRSIEGHLESARGGQLETSAEASGDKCRNSDTCVDLVALYRARVGIGRNNALFEAAMAARDRGCTQQMVVQALGNVHALQPDPKGGALESFCARYKEALGTIRSVFSRPPRSVTPTEETAEQAQRGLSNSVREWLLGHGLSAAARVIDGLYLAGLKVGAAFTERRACGLLERFKIGRRSVMNALKTLLPDGLPIFRQTQESPSIPPDTANAAANAEDEITKCDFVTGAKRVKTPGRPARMYILPSNDDLISRLGVGIPTPSAQADAIAPDDLNSPSAYRRALHRVLIARRPGQYSRHWLARRLGVSRWTCQRYEAAIGISVHAVYSAQPVTWGMLEHLPAHVRDAQPGTFLEADGRRYPPLQAIAARLLMKRQPVLFRRRLPNEYRLDSVGIPTPAAESMPSDRQYSYSHSEDMRTEDRKIPQPQTNQPNIEQVFWYCPVCLTTHVQPDQPEPCLCSPVSIWQQLPAHIWQNQNLLQRWWQTEWRTKHSNAPRRATPMAGKQMHTLNITYQQPSLVAQKAHQQVKGLSLRTAQGLVNHYGDIQIEKALRILRHRTNVANPAGFLITLLKSENLFYKTDSEVVTNAIPDSQTWVQQMAASDYLDFLVNADEFLSKG